MRVLERIRIVLVEPQHPGNIGAAARAMRTMGLQRLVLVAPHRFPHSDAVAMAAGADDVLAGARIVATLDEAIGDCRLAYGCTARVRGVRLPARSPRDAATELIAAATDAECALVFGRERTGLTNEEVQRCHAAVQIDADPTYASLNLAAAVQVLCYELRCAARAAPADAPQHERAAREPAATVEELEGLFGHLQQALAEIDFFKGRAPTTIMRRLRRLYLRAALTQREVLILRGILSDAQRMARLAGVASSANARSEHIAGLDENGERQ
jgi:tRNA (cytidine32/uridine32-2'-O)-methyltransferase